MTRNTLIHRNGAALFLLALPGILVVLASCASAPSGEGPTPAVRVIWHDFEQERRQGISDASRARQVGIDEMVLVTATFDGGSYSQALEQGRLPPTVKVIDREIMTELLAAFEQNDFFDQAQGISLSSLIGDELVRAAITVERAGFPPATLVHGKGAGSSADGGAIVRSFLACKNLVRQAYNSTVQYGRVSVTRESP